MEALATISNGEEVSRLFNDIIKNHGYKLKGIVNRFIYNLSDKEIADTLGIPLNTVRARQRLKELIDENEWYW